MSKATPLGASVKFASAGKRIGKKDLAMQAISYGNVYVAQVAMGANPQQTLLAMREAEEYPGPSLILAYSPCIAHGYDLAESLQQQKLATLSGYWPLIRYNPALRAAGKKPFRAGFTPPEYPAEGLRLQRDALQDSDQDESGRCRPAAGKRPGTGRTALGNLRVHVQAGSGEIPAGGVRGGVRHHRR